MTTSLDLERELRRAYEVIERQSRTIESLTALLSQAEAEEEDQSPEAGYLNSRG